MLLAGLKSRESIREKRNTRNVGKGEGDEAEEEGRSDEREENGGEGGEGVEGERGKHLSGNIYTVYDLTERETRRAAVARSVKKTRKREEEENEEVEEENKEEEDDDDDDGDDDDDDEEKESDEEGRAHESKTVAVYGGFYGVTHRETTALLLSILAIEIGCLLIGARLSRDLNDSRAGRAEDSNIARAAWRPLLHRMPRGISTRQLSRAPTAVFSTRRLRSHDF